MNKQLPNTVNALSSSVRIAWRSSDILAGWTTAGLRLGVLPLINVIYMLAMSRHADEATSLAATTQGAALTAVAVTAAIDATDRRSGTLSFLVLGTVSRPVVQAGRVVFAAGVGSVTAVFCFVIASLANWHDVPHGAHRTTVFALYGLLAICVTALATACFGVALGALGLRIRDPYLLSNLAGSALLLFCGVVAPVSTLPGWLGAVSRCLPLTHGVTAARSLAATHSGLVADLGLELLVGVAWLVLGLLVSSRVERSAIRAGGLEKM